MAALAAVLIVFFAGYYAGDRQEIEAGDNAVIVVCENVIVRDCQE